MQRTDYYLSMGIYILGFSYIGMVLQIPEKAAKYPMFVGVLLLVLNTIFTIQVFISRKKNKPIEEKLFAGFIPKQFLIVLVTAISYIILIGILGFYTSTILYMIISLGLLGVKKKWTVVTTVGFCILVYVAFNICLRVPFPKGYII